MTLKQAINYLQQHSITDAESSARFLLKDLMESSNYSDEKYQEYLTRRAQHEPTDYILGYTNFCGLKINVNKDVLIPRPETEQLVEIVIDYLNPKSEILNQKQNSKLQIIDVGTGSGAIALALASKLSNINIIATDISDEALKLAKQNARALGFEKRIKFIQSDLLKSLDTKYQILNTILVANLPYIPSARIKNLMPEVREFEPHLALDGGTDGLKYYRQLFKQITEKNIKPQAIFCEIDETHRQTFKILAKQYFPEAKTATKKDLAALTRFGVVKF